MNTHNVFLDNAVNDELEMECIGDLTTDVCSDMQNDTEKMCLSLQNATCRSRRVAMQSRYLEIFDFTLFLDYFVFTPNAENVLEKKLKREIPVSVGIEWVVVDMSKMLNL